MSDNEYEKQEIRNWINKELDTNGRITITDVDNNSRFSKLMVLTELYKMEEALLLKSQLENVGDIIKSEKKERVFTRNEGS